MLKQFNSSKQFGLTKLLINKPSFGLRIRVAREINYNFENERKAYREEMKKYRVKHAEEFWNTQTQAENFYIANYQKERHAKQMADMDRLRNNIARISMHTKTKLANLEKSKANTIERMRLKDISNMKRNT